MRIAQILYGKAHWIFNPLEIFGKDEIPTPTPDPNGVLEVFVDITGKPEVQEGWLYEDGVFTEPPEPEPLPPQMPAIAPVNNEEIVQAVMYLTAIQDIANIHTQSPIQAASAQTFGVTTQSSRYEFWRYAYFRQHTNEFTLNELAENGVLTPGEVEQIISDRMQEYGI